VSYVGKAVDGKLDLMVLIGRQPTITTNCCIFTLKMATAVFAETLHNSRHTMRFDPKAEAIQTTTLFVPTDTTVFSGLWRVFMNNTEEDIWTQGRRRSESLDEFT
jgi:hypothetical protein